MCSTPPSSGDPRPHELTVEITPTGPWHGAHLLDFVGSRAIAGVEGSTPDGGFARVLEIRGEPVLLGVRPTPATDETAAVEVVVVGTDRVDAELVIDRARRLLDIANDGEEIDSALGADPLLGESVRMQPGLRSPGSADAAETVARAILGQQVSVERARNLLAMIAVDHGEPLSPDLSDHPLARQAQLRRMFPAPEVLAEIDPDTLPMPRTRAAALMNSAEMIASGDLILEGEVDAREVRARLLEIHGIGPWTADYVLLRGLGEPDVFLPSDLGIRRSLEARGLHGTATEFDRLARRWSPWRSYALHRLWFGIPGSVDAD